MVYGWVDQRLDNFATKLELKHVLSIYSETGKNKNNKNYMREILTIRFGRLNNPAS